MNARALTIGLTGAVLLVGSGCIGPTPRAHVLPEGNVRRILEAYPQEAETARLSAPAFTRDALKTISGLEEMLAIGQTFQLAPDN